MRTGTRHTVIAALAGTTALAATFTLGWAMAPGASDGPGAVPRPGFTPVAYAAASGLEAPESCEALLDSFVERGIDQVGPYGWDGGWGGDFVAGAESSDSAGAGADASAPVPLARSQRATSSETGTNVQEAGVDEPDVVKTAGPLLARIQDDALVLLDVAGATPTEIASLDLAEVNEGMTDVEPQWWGAPQAGLEMLLVDDRIVVLAGHENHPTSAVAVVDITDPGSPELVSTTEVTGSLSQARLHGDTVRLVVRRGLPQLDFSSPSGLFGEVKARIHNRSLVRDTELADWLPTVGGEPVDCDTIAIPDEGPLGSTTVLAFDPAEVADDQPLAAVSAGIATSTETSYFSADRFYVVTGPGTFFPGCDWGICERVVAPEDGTTRVHAFEVGDLSTTYVASGEVEGTIKDRWSMDSVGGVLRLAVGPDWRTGDFNSVVTLVEEDGELVEAGRVDDLGPGEEIKSVRWFDDLAIVVTFRQTDPLYAVDLTDDRAPRLVGELKIPGFSEYLHPLGSMRMLGIGQDADPRTGQALGAQASLFDVTDLTSPRQIDVAKLPVGTVAGAATDPRQFTWLPDRRTALTVVSQGSTGRTGWLVVLRLGNGEVRSEMREVEHGVDVSSVRTVPLASGKVALVTEDDVTFVDL